MRAQASTRHDLDCLLPLSVLSSYLFFLRRRPISASNAHYLARRIRGLQSLASALDGGDDDGLQAIVTSLKNLEPANFARVSRDLQFRLALVHQPPHVPADYVVSHHPLAASPLAGARRLLMVLGPAIGIGDEIILFPVPRRICEVAPGVDITVMSGYDGLWDRVDGVRRREYYATHRDLVDAVRHASRDGYDAVLLADFEKPGLATAACHEPDLPLYVELSLGGQCAVVVDRQAGTIHGVTLPAEARLNYYDALERLLEWLHIGGNAASRYDGLVRRAAMPAPSPIRVFVSPFTSKYEASVLYWSRLLASVSDCEIGDLEFAVDAGASLSTEQFATALIRGTNGGGSRRRFTLCTDSHARTLSLAGALDEMERSHIVLCADSYAAHAGPLFGCTTVVVARAGLEPWRTPFERSFYFDIEQPLAAMAAAMRRVFAGAMRVPVSLPSTAAVDLHEATVALGRLLADGDGHQRHDVERAYDRLTESYSNVVHDLGRSPSDYSALVQDVEYARPWRPFEALSRHSAGDAYARLRIELARWERTNLRKALILAMAAEAP